MGIFLSSVACVPTILLVHAWANGTLKQLIYYCYTYNIQIHRAGGQWSLPPDVLQRYPCFLLTIGAVVAVIAGDWAKSVSRVVRARPVQARLIDFGVRDYIALEFVFALGTAAMLPQFFEHYYLVPIALLSIWLAGIPALAKRRRSEPYVRWCFLGAAAVFVVGSVQTAWLRERPDGRVAHGPVVEQVGQYITRHTAVTDTIFVWGFSPWLYEYSHRRPAGRFVFTTYPIGFVPWFRDAMDQEALRVVPGAMDELLGDLKREQPSYVVDAGSVSIARPMRAYPGPAALLHDRYCFEVRIGSFDLYRIASADRPCKTTHFPRPADPVDHFDQPLPVAMPRVVDFDESCMLPTRLSAVPVKFGDDCQRLDISQSL
jgi:hypothetical protein